MSTHYEPAAGQTPAPPPQPAPEFETTASAEGHAPSGTEQLVEELARRLSAGERFDNASLNKLAAQFFGGTRAEGTFTPRDAYDAAEVAACRVLLRHGADLMLSVPNAALPLKLAVLPLLDRLPRQTDRTEEQITYQQFSTPPHMSYLAARVAAIRPGEEVIESSAGTGSLAVWPLSLGCRVHTNELSSRRRDLLRLLGFEPTAYDAQFIHDLLPDAVRPTLALHNPPFSSSAGMVEGNHMEFGLRHIESVLERLEPGGRYVGYFGRGLAFDRPRFAEWWIDIASRYNVRANVSLPDKEYSRYGTSFGFQLVVIDKDGPTPGSDWDEQLAHVVAGEPASVEEALGLLAHVAATRPAPFAAPAAINPGTQAAQETAPGPVPQPASVADTQTPAPVSAAGAVEAQAAQDEASPAPADAAEQQTAPEEEEPGVYVPYVPRKLKGGVPHPTPLVEAATMACVSPPDITYRPRLQPHIITEGRLSDVQLERVIYAGQRHEQRLGNGARAGFVVADGPGVGKGRTIGGIIVDNYNQGRRRAVWFSTSADLLVDSRQYIGDLGVPIRVVPLSDYDTTSEIDLAEGVLFCTYSTLISSAKSGETRLDQIRRWLGPDGVVIFDEAHRAKNAMQEGPYGKPADPTLTAQAVLDMQDPELGRDYRVVYSSATVVTIVRNMAFMVRLGLWGEGTSFPGGFGDFLLEIEKGGIGAMEMLAREMKARGMYLSASISYKGVEYYEAIHHLTPQQREMYDHAAKAWQVVLNNIDLALGVTGAPKKVRNLALQKFWGDHQRFFRLMVTALKIPTIIKVAEEGLAAGQAVVISLIGTGEARTKEEVADALAHGTSLDDLDFSPRRLLASAIERCFPTSLYQSKTDKNTKKTKQVLVKDPSTGKAVDSKKALKMKQELLDGLSLLDLPEHPLDQLINHFGPENVSELTGRKHRLVRNPLTGHLEYKRRAPEGIAMSKANLFEMAQFQQGFKFTAVISQAAQTGISLHSSNRVANRRRRRHITAELSFSADAQLQTFGRTHRSDQAYPPEYWMVTTELGGERRFASTVARRLASLGALSKGDRAAADGGGVLGKYSYESPYGVAALKLMFKRLTEAMKAGEKLELQTLSAGADEADDETAAQAPAGPAQSAQQEQEEPAAETPQPPATPHEPQDQISALEI